MISSVLKVYSTPTKLDVNTVTPIISAKYIKPQLDIEKTDGSYVLGKKSIKLDVDSTQCQAEEGHKTISELTAEYAQEGIESAQEAAQEFADEGQDMLDAKPGEKVMQQIGWQKSVGSDYQYGLKFIPSQRPQINWITDETQSDVEPPQYTYNWDVASRADVELERAGSCEITVAQYPSFSFEIDGDFNSLKSFECYA